MYENALETTILEDFPDNYNFWKIVSAYRLPFQETVLYLELLFEQGKIHSRRGIPYSDEEILKMRDYIRKRLSFSEISRKINRPVSEVKELLNWYIKYINHSQFAIGRMKKIYFTEKLLENTTIALSAREVGELLGHSEKSAKRDMDYIKENKKENNYQKTSMVSDEYLKEQNLSPPKDSKERNKEVREYLHHQKNKIEQNKKMIAFREIWNKRAMQQK